MALGRDMGHSMHTMNIGSGIPQNNMSENLINTLQKTKNDPL